MIKCNKRQSRTALSWLWKSFQYRCGVPKINRHFKKVVGQPWMLFKSLWTNWNQPKLSKSLKAPKFWIFSQSLQNIRGSFCQLHEKISTYSFFGRKFGHLNFNAMELVHFLRCNLPRKKAILSQLLNLVSLTFLWALFCTSLAQLLLAYFR